MLRELILAQARGQSVSKELQVAALVENSTRAALMRSS